MKGQAKGIVARREALLARLAPYLEPEMLARLSQSLCKWTALARKGLLDSDPGASRIDLAERGPQMAFGLLSRGGLAEVGEDAEALYWRLPSSWDVAAGEFRLEDV